MSLERKAEIRVLNLGPFNETVVNKKKDIPAQRKIHDKIKAQLDTIHIDDPESQKSLLDQALTAISDYPVEKRVPDKEFNPFAFFLEPHGKRFFVGDLEGLWDALGTFHLQSVIIHHVCDSIAEIEELTDVIQHLNPGVPKVASSSFLAAVHPKSN